MGGGLSEFCIIKEATTESFIMGWILTGIYIVNSEYKSNITEQHGTNSNKKARSPHTMIKVLPPEVLPP